MSNVTLYLGDCLEYMRGMADGCIDVVVTDPPYGANKAAWDATFPTEWYEHAKQLAPMTVIITGSRGTKDSMRLVGDDFVDTIAARNLNGMTRGPIGFNNWLAAVIAGSKPHKSNSWNFFEFSIREDMPDHPSPKPIEYMLKLIERVTNPGDTIFDPFMGSGTTGVACVQLGRNFIGCEIDPQYYAISERRIRDAQAQPSLLEAPHA